MTLGCPDHIVRDRHGIQEVRCKVCGATIRSVVPIDHIPPRLVKDGPRLHYHHMAQLGVNANYAELTLVCQDGGRQNYHVTHCCASCLPKIKDDLEILDKMYQADLTEMLIGEGIDRRAVDAWRTLKVVGIKEEETE